MANQDHHVYSDMSHINGEAMNAASAEDAGIKDTRTEVCLGSKLLSSIAGSLLP